MNRCEWIDVNVPMWINRCEWIDVKGSMWMSMSRCESIDVKESMWRDRCEWIDVKIRDRCEWIEVKILIYRMCLIKPLSDHDTCLRYKWGKTYKHGPNHQPSSERRSTSETRCLICSKLVDMFETWPDVRNITRCSITRCSPVQTATTPRRWRRPRNQTEQRFVWP